jgi:acyl-CoA thioester hydrolase
MRGGHSRVTMGAEGFVETYRGAVGAWECDAFGHLNIAFYPARLAAAACDLLERAWPGARWRTTALHTRYLAELRAGEAVIVRSAVLAADDTTVRLAHEAVTPEGTVTTRAEHALAQTGAPARPMARMPGAAGWERFAAPAIPAGEGSIAAGRSRVLAGECEDGAPSLGALVHRCSDACLFVVEALGMSAAYRRDANRGFATFETLLALEAARAEAGDGIVVASGIVALGGASLRMLHRLRRARDGALVATVYQAGVQFDLAARRSAPWPAEFRATADSLVIAAA